MGESTIQLVGCSEMSEVSAKGIERAVFFNDIVSDQTSTVVYVRRHLVTQRLRRIRKTNGLLAANDLFQLIYLIGTMAFCIFAFFVYAGVILTYNP